MVLSSVLKCVSAWILGVGMDRYRDRQEASNHGLPMEEYSQSKMVNGWFVGCLICSGSSL